MSNPLLETPNRILPALVTPLTPSGDLDVRSSERLIDHLYQKGVGGLYLTGSTGEGIYLSREIRQRLVEVATQMMVSQGVVGRNDEGGIRSLRARLDEHFKKGRLHGFASALELFYERR